MTSANECSGVPIGECSLRRRRQGINNNIYIQAKLFISLPVHNHSLNPFSFFQGDRTTRTPRSGPFLFFAFPLLPPVFLPRFSSLVPCPLRSPLLVVVLSPALTLRFSLAPKYYPSLNRSRCCMKGICTECFLQMKPPHSTRPSQCPFCKTSNYAVEYHGAKTKEEKGVEQVEEQKVIEAQIRIRQQELQDEAERTKKRQNLSSSSRTMTPTDVGHHDISNTSTSVPSMKCSIQSSDLGSRQASCSAPVSTRPSQLRQNRDNNLDLDLEDVMVMEAIWLSIQEQGSQGNPSCVGSYLPRPSTSGEWHSSHGTAPMRPSSSGGLACAAAALAERQHMHGNSAVHMAIDNAAACDMLQRSGSSSPGITRFVHDNPSGRWTEISPDNGREVHGQEFGECLADHQSEVAEAGTSYNVETGAMTGPLSEGVSIPPGHFVPESFEEQMMLAMAVSLAEARARMSNHGVSLL